MKSIKTLSIAILSSVLLISCGEETKEENTDSSEIAKETCTYSYVADSTTLKWTAYKFTKRAGVSGTFDHITVNNAKSSNNPLEVLIGADFSIRTSSVNSGNEERDPKLVKFFFEQLADTEMIKGKIVSVNNGEAIVTITLNGNSVDVVGKLTVDGNKVTLATSIDMADFNGLDAIASLHEVCSAKHTDEDGKSKLWSDVDIVVSTVLKKVCK
ncbi:MAG: YceI family protein [Cyclobacteriaceae bacterium]|nr:YceI family protein [Cyclobacteriaceae bacterium]